MDRCWLFLCKKGRCYRADNISMNCLCNLNEPTFISYKIESYSYAADNYNFRLFFAWIDFLSYNQEVMIFSYEPDLLEVNVPTLEISK